MSHDASLPPLSTVEEQAMPSCATDTTETADNQGGKVGKVTRNNKVPLFLSAEEAKLLSRIYGTGKSRGARIRMRLLSVDSRLFTEDDNRRLRNLAQAQNDIHQVARAVRSGALNGTPMQSVAILAKLFEIAALLER